MKIAGLFVDPKGITLRWNWTLWVEKAVLGLSSYFTRICQFPEAHTEPHPKALTHHLSDVVVWYSSLSTVLSVQYSM